jgi:hypothetical protein
MTAIEEITTLRARVKALEAELVQLREKAKAGTLAKAPTTTRAALEQEYAAMPGVTIEDARKRAQFRKLHAKELGL